MNSFSKILSDNWKIQSSEKIDIGGGVISTEGYAPDGWIQADVPSI